MKKLFTVFTCFLFLITSVFSQIINAGVIKGIGALPATDLYNSDYDFSLNLYDNSSDLVRDLLEKRINVCIVPVNIAASLYNLTSGDYKAVAITQNGTEKILTRNKKLKTIENFIGHSVSIPLKNSISDCFFQWILQHNKILIDKEIHVDYSINMNRLPNALVQGNIESVVLQEPFATLLLMNNKDIYESVDFQQEYEAFLGSQKRYPLMIMMVNKDLFTENKNDFLQFLSAYEKSSAKIIQMPSSAASLCRAYGLNIPENLIYTSVKKSGLIFVKGKEMQKQTESLFNIIQSFDIHLLGGKVPDNGFYLTL